MVIFLFRIEQHQAIMALQDSLVNQHFIKMFHFKIMYFTQYLYGVIYKKEHMKM